MKIPTFELTDKNALVTGATKGLGYGMAIGLAQAGANVIVVSRTPADCERVAEEIDIIRRLDSSRIYIGDGMKHLEFDSYMENLKESRKIFEQLYSKGEET